MTGSWFQAERLFAKRMSGCSLRKVAQQAERERYGLPALEAHQEAVSGEVCDRGGDRRSTA